MKYKYWLRRKKLLKYSSRSSVNYLTGIVFFIFTLFVFYVSYYFIFFIFVGKISVDATIGFSIFFLFFLLYRSGRKFIRSYVSSFTKNLYLNYFTLIKLLLTFRALIYRYNRVYLRFFRYNFFVLKIVSNSMSLVYNKLSLVLLNKYLINLIYNKLSLKLYYVTSKTNKLPIEHVFISNSVFELNKFLAFDTLFFLI
jgi:hypothetical protein